MQLSDCASRRVGRVCVGVVVFWAVILGFVQVAKTATITLQRSNSPRSDEQIIACEIRLDGTIEENDSKKLSQKLRLFELTEQPTLCLNSSGGSYEEGLIIAELIVNRRLSTAVDADATCLSACVIVFLSGNVSNEDSSIRPSRRLHVAGKLGFKEPYDEGLSAVKQLIALHPELIRKELIVEMSEHVPDKTFFINTVGQAIEYSVNVFGVRGPQEFSEVSSEMLCDICDNANQGNGHCVKGSRKIDINLDPYMQLSDVTSSFLNYGPEGGQRCVIAMARSAQGMVVQIRGAGKDAAFQRVFFYPWSAPLISLPLDEARFQSPAASH
jgi:hypothetical protein